MFNAKLWNAYVYSGEAELIETLHGLGDAEYGDRIARILASDIDRLVEAREKHPKVGENVYHALGALSAEHGEVCQELEKHREGWEERMDEELKDVRVVALRMSLREYEHGEDA